MLSKERQLHLYLIRFVVAFCSVDGILQVVCGSKRVAVNKSPLPAMWPSESAPSGLAALAAQDYTDSGLVEYCRNNHWSSEAMSTNL